MRTTLLRLASLLACIPLAGCEILPLACDDVGHPFLVIEVRDAVTGRPAAEGATGRVTDGEYTAALQVTSPAHMQPDDWERAGTYDVLIQAPGYREWRRDDVRVRDGGCHVRTVELKAELEPIPPGVP